MPPPPRPAAAVARKARSWAGSATCSTGMGGNAMRRPLTTIALLAALSAVPALAADRHGPVRGYMDTKTPPCQDFFRYCNGAWGDSVSIPAAYSGVGAGREMNDRNQ